MKAIVTGHTRGLGAAFAEELLSRNFTVLGVSRSKNAELAQRFPAALMQTEVDLADAKALERYLASGAARNPYPGWSLYCASKAALDQHAKAVALDKTPHRRGGGRAPGAGD